MKSLVSLNLKLYTALLLVFILAACNSPWQGQKYSYLNRIAVAAKAEADTIRNHVPKKVTKAPSSEIAVYDSTAGSVLISSDSKSGIREKISILQTWIPFAREEAMRVSQKFSRNSFQSGGEGKMSTRNPQIWWLWGVLLFIIAFIIAVALIRLANESGSGCLFFFTFFLMIGLLTWLVFLVIL